MIVKSVEKLEHSAVELLIEVPKEEFEAAIEKVYQRQKNRISVPGFRKGKAPRKIIEGMYGASVFYEDAINDLYPAAYSQAVEQEKLDIVSYPQVEIVNVGKDGFSFKAKVTVRPQATLKNYKGLAAVKEKVELTDEEIDAELKPYIDRATRIVTVDRPARNGDIVVIDYEGFDNGVPFEGGKDEGHELELGSNTFIPGFEDQVVGMSAGEEKEIHVTFPEEYHAKELAGKPVMFRVKVHEVKERVAPELDDDFAQDVSEFDTLEDLKKDLADKLLKRKQAQADRRFEEALLDQLIANMEVEIPDPMVEYHADKLVDDYAMRISSQGIPFEQYLQMMGMTRENMREQAKPGALRQLQSQLALDAVAAAEGLEISEEEVEAELKQLSEQYNMEVERIRQIISDSDLKSDLLRQKALKLVVEHAVVSDGKEESAEPKKKTTKKAAAKKAEESGQAAAEPKRTRKSAEKKADAEAKEE